MYSSSINKEFIPKILPDLYIEMGMLLKQDTISYRSICDSYILWSRGKASAKLYNDGKENDHEKNFNDMFVSGVVSNRMWSVCFKK